MEDRQTSVAKAFLSRLSPVEREFLHLFSDRLELSIHDSTAFARSNGLMLSLLVDEINEKAFEHLGDLLLEEIRQSYVIPEDRAHVIRQEVLI